MSQAGRKSTESPGDLAEEARSGPIAKALKVTRIRKKTTPRLVPPPMRCEARRSRMKSAKSGDFAACLAGTPSAFSWHCPEPQFAARKTEVCMSGGDDHAAFCQLRRHDLRHQSLGGRVEGGQGLVQEPYRALHDEEPGERHPPSLPGREIAAGRPATCERPNAQALFPQPCHHARVKHRAKEFQIFGHREEALEASACPT